MLVTTKAIVLSKLKYQDNDLIIKCYTQQFGVQSYLLRGVLKSKKSKFKTAYFIELSQLQITINYKENRSLQSLRDVRPLAFYQTIHSNIYKSAIAMFLAEVLSSILKEEESNTNLYSYLETTLLWFDEHDNAANFHLLFLLKLTRYLGFYPDETHQEFDYFDLEEGQFVIKKTSKYCVFGAKIAELKQLLGMNFDALNEAHFNADRRQEFLKMLLLYFELHLGSLKQPKSLHILNQVFS